MVYHYAQMVESNLLQAHLTYWMIFPMTEV